MKLFLSLYPSISMSLFFLGIIQGGKKENAVLEFTPLSRRITMGAHILKSKDRQSCLLVKPQRL